MRFLREAAERLRPVGQADIRSFEAFRQVLARIERVRYEDVESEMAVFGDPDYCIDRVQALHREYGMDEFICYFNQGGIMDHAIVRQSMTRFAREVMPDLHEGEEAREKAKAERLAPAVEAAMSRRKPPRTATDYSFQAAAQA